MDRLTRWTFLVILVVSICHVQTLETYCACSHRHPQTHFCDSTFAALVTVRKLLQPNDKEIAYKVEVNTIFKATPDAQKALRGKYALLWSPSLDVMCGRSNLIPKEEYLVTGGMRSGKLYISLCDFVQPWSEVTLRQREGFQQLYERSCPCPILDSQENHTSVSKSTGRKGCVRESSPGPRDCQERYGICMLNKPAGCSWMSLTVAYNKCVLEHQRLRVLYPHITGHCKKILELFPTFQCD